MKKSFLSFLLGVAVIASTSVFVSCQDYQDEFKDLQEQFDKEHPALNNKVTALETEIQSLEATVAALQSQHDADIAALQAADDQLKDLLSDEMVKANAYALAQAEKALADAKAYADAVAETAAAQALKEAQAYADKVAAAEAQKEAQAALLAANEQSQALFNDAISQLNKAVDTINGLIAAEKADRQASEAALEAGYMGADAASKAAYEAADAAIWTAINKANADIAEAAKAAEAAQATADKALALANTNAAGIANEVARATQAEADLKAGILDNASAIEKEAAQRAADTKAIWEAINKANDDIAANAKSIQDNYADLSGKFLAVMDRLKTLENQVATLQEEMKAAQQELADQDARIISLEAWTVAYEEQIKKLQDEMAAAQENIAKLQEQVEKEVAERVAADSKLQGNIDAEATTREEADKQLNALVAANLAKIENEIIRAQAREAELAAGIQKNKEDIAALAIRVAANELAIAALQEDLGNETAARIEADKAEENARIAADLSESAAREAADVQENTERVAADAQEAIERQNADLKEASDRAAADAKETAERIQAILDEASARKTADEDLQNQINTEIAERKAAIEAEAAARIQAILDEAKARAEGDADLKDLITAEEKARIEAITAETAARIAAVENEAALRQAADDAEAAAREAADTKLAAAILAGDAAEAEARAKAIVEAIAAEVEARNKAIGEEAALRETEDIALGNKIATEENARKAGDAAEAEARETADNKLAADFAANLAAEVATLVEADKALQQNIDFEAAAREAADYALQHGIDSALTAIAEEKQARELADSKLGARIDSVADALKTFVEGEYADFKKATTEAIDDINGKLEDAYTNNFAIVTDVFQYVVEVPSLFFQYYNKYDVPSFPKLQAGDVPVPGVLGMSMCRAQYDMVPDTKKQTEGYAVYLLNPVNISHYGQVMHWFDEKGASHPFYTLGTAVKDNTPEDYYYNVTGYSILTRAGEQANTVLYRSSVAFQDTLYANDRCILNFVDQGGVAPTPDQDKYKNKGDKKDVMLARNQLYTHQRFALAAEYQQKNFEGDTITEYCYSDFEFEGRMAHYFFKMAEDLDTTKMSYKVTGNDTTYMQIKIAVNDNRDNMIVKQIVYCSDAINACKDATPAEINAAIEYINGLIGGMPKNVGGYSNGLLLNIDKKYEFWSFTFQYDVLDKNGNYWDFKPQTVTVTPEIVKTSQTIKFTHVPTSAADQYTEAKDIKPEILWNNLLPNCAELTANLTNIEGTGYNGLTFIGTPGWGAPASPYYWNATTADGKSDTYGKDAVETLTKLAIAYKPANMTLWQTYKWQLDIKFGDVTISTDTIIFEMASPSCHIYKLTPITSAWNKAKTKTIVWADKGAKDASGVYYRGRYWMKGSYTDIEDYNTPESDGCKLAFRDSTDYTGCDSLKIIKMPAADEWKIVVPSYAVKNNTGLDQPSFDFLKCWYDLNYGTEYYGLENLYADSTCLQIAFCSPIYYDGVIYNWEAGQYEGGCSLPDSAYVIDFPRQETTIKSADFVGSNDPSTSVVDPIVYFGPSRDVRILDVTVEMGDASEIAATYPDYYVWNDPTNMKLFEVEPTVTDDGIYFKTYDEQPSLQSKPAFYYNLVVTDVWGCVKTYPFVIAVKPNTPLN